MNRKILIFILLILSTLLIYSQEMTSYSVETYILMTPESRKQIIEWTESSGGYFLRDSSSQLLLRIPNELIQELKPVLEERALKVLSYSMTTRSLDFERNSTQAAIASRQEILERNLGFLDEADLTGTLMLEKEIASIIQELEYYKGRLRVLDNEAIFALVTVFLTAPQPDKPDSGQSSFSWLNTLDFYQFIRREFR